MHLESQSSELTTETNCAFIFSSITGILSNVIRLLICLTYSHLKMERVFFAMPTLQGYGC